MHRGQQFSHVLFDDERPFDAMKQGLVGETDHLVAINPGDVQEMGAVLDAAKAEIVQRGGRFAMSKLAFDP